MSRMISEIYRPPPSDPAQNVSSDQSELEDRSVTSDIGEWTDRRTNQSRFLQTGTLTWTQVQSGLSKDEFINVWTWSQSRTDCGPGPGVCLWSLSCCVTVVCSVEAAGGGGLQLFVDSNVSVDSALIRQLVNEVLTETVALMLGQRDALDTGPGPGLEPPKAGAAAHEEVKHSGFRRTPVCLFSS